MRPITMMQAQFKADTQEGESLQFLNCKGGYFSVTDDFGLQVVGKTAQDGTPSQDNPVPIQCVKAGTKALVSGKNILSEQMMQLSNGNSLLVDTDLNGDRWVRMRTGSGYYLIRGVPLIASSLAIQMIVKNLSGFHNEIRIDVKYEDGTVEYGTNWKVIYEKDEFEIKTARYIVNTRNKAIADIMVASTYNGEFAIKENASQIEIGSIYTEIDPSTTGGVLTTPCDLYEDDIWYPMSGKVERHNAIIESYNGEAIPSSYVSTTGGLDTGATIVYALDAPITEQYDPQPIHAPSSTVNVMQALVELSGTLSATMLVRR